MDEGRPQWRTWMGPRRWRTRWHGRPRSGCSSSSAMAWWRTWPPPSPSSSSPSSCPLRCAPRCRLEPRPHSPVGTAAARVHVQSPCIGTLQHVCTCRVRASGDVVHCGLPVVTEGLLRTLIYGCKSLHQLRGCQQSELGTCSCRGVCSHAVRHTLTSAQRGCRRWEKTGRA